MTDETKPETDVELVREPTADEVREIHEKIASVYGRNSRYCVCILAGDRAHFTSNIDPEIVHQALDIFVRYARMRFNQTESLNDDDSVRH